MRRVGGVSQPHGCDRSSHGVHVGFSYCHLHRVLRGRRTRHAEHGVMRAMARDLGGGLWPGHRKKQEKKKKRWNIGPPATNSLQSHILAIFDLRLFSGDGRLWWVPVCPNNIMPVVGRRQNEGRIVDAEATCLESDGKEDSRVYDRVRSKKTMNMLFR
jgi:hypothetical protein